MVSLGFISSSEQCPDHVRHVRIREDAAREARPGQASVRIFVDSHGRTRWILDWHVSEPAEVASWAPLLAERMINLAWPAWWLDVGSLQQAMNLPVDKSLALWGQVYWSAYHQDALVFLDVGRSRRVIYQVVRQWERQTPHVRFSTQHDLDAAS